MTTQPILLAFGLLAAVASTIQAGTFDGSVSIAGSAPVVRILNCDLVKTSFKGDNKSWLGDAEKSVESTCLAGDKPIKFSATADKWQTLLELAGQPVVVRLAENKGIAKDAKTDWVLVDIHSKAASKPVMSKLCGSDQAKPELATVWSHGYRVGRVVDIWKGRVRDKDEHWDGPQKRHEDDWYIDVRMSNAGNYQWAPDGSVRLGAVCADTHAELADATTPLVFVYDQGDEDPEYVVVEIYSMQ